MKAIHDGKSKNNKIAALLRAGDLPEASGGRRMGNVHLKWAFSEAAALYLRSNPQGKKLFKKLERKRGRPQPASKVPAILMWPS